MIETFQAGGFMMWPILLVAVGVAVLVARTAGALRRPEPASREEARRTMNAVLFWGAMAVALGALGTLIGLIQMSGAIQRAGAVSTSLAWGGVGVALITLAFGLLTFLASAFLWLALHAWLGRSRRRGEMAHG